MRVIARGLRAVHEVVRCVSEPQDAGRIETHLTGVLEAPYLTRFIEEFGVRAEEAIEPLFGGPFPDVVVEVVRAGAAILVDICVRERVRAVLGVYAF